MPPSDKLSTVSYSSSPIHKVRPKSLTSVGRMENGETVCDGRNFDTMLVRLSAPIRIGDLHSQRGFLYQLVVVVGVERCCRVRQLRLQRSRTLIGVRNGQWGPPHVSTRRGKLVSFVYS